MERFINTRLVAAVQMTTPEENPLVTDNNRLMDVWFFGPPVRKQLFKKVTRAEQEAMRTALLDRGFVQAGNLLLNPAVVLFVEMENQLLGGLVTIGFGDNNKPVELKVNGKVFAELCESLRLKR